VKVFVPARKMSSGSFPRRRGDDAARRASGLRVVSHSIRESSRSQSGDSSGGINVSQELSSNDLGLIRDYVIGSDVLPNPNEHQQPSRLAPILDDSFTSTALADTCSETKLDLLDALNACIELDAENSLDSGGNDKGIGVQFGDRLEL